MAMLARTGWCDIENVSQKVELSTFSGAHRVQPSLPAQALDQFRQDRMDVTSMQSDLVAAHRANGVSATIFSQDLGSPRLDHKLGNDTFFAQDVGQPDRILIDFGIILVIRVLVADDDQYVHGASFSHTPRGW